MNVQTLEITQATDNIQEKTRENVAPQKFIPLGEVTQAVHLDSRRASHSYLEEAVVPGGGE